MRLIGKLECFIFGISMGLILSLVIAYCVLQR
jgi:hypothetical protein